MRTLLIVLVAFGLSACNLVYTEKPLWTAADARGAPKLKPGVWVNPKPDCAFEPKQTPLPECAHAATITAEALLPPPGEAARAEGEPDRLPYVLVAGDPPVMQLELDLKKAERRWLYVGLRPLKTDNRGRVTEIRFWLAQCGPPPPKGSKEFVTAQPLPGLKIVENDCIPDDAASVFRAAKASEAWDEDKDSIRWLRDK